MARLGGPGSERTCQGALMPAMLSGYELVSLLLLQRTFAREFVEDASKARLGGSA